MINFSNNKIFSLLSFLLFIGVICTTLAIKNQHLNSKIAQESLRFQSLRLLCEQYQKMHEKMVINNDALYTQLHPKITVQSKKPIFIMDSQYILCTAKLAFSMLSTQSILRYLSQDYGIGKIYTIEFNELDGLIEVVLEFIQ